MKSLLQISEKKTKLVVGLMSGTSADGIDAALVEIAGSGFQTKLRQIAFHTYPYPRGYKRLLLKNSSASTARLDDIARLNMLIADFFADAVKKIAQKARMPLTAIDLIGSHGQTIHHLPAAAALFGKSIRATLQIGSPSAIAKHAGIITVGDFRTGDVAVGGSGAPLVPYFDYIMFRSKTKSRAMLNIGGIANITLLPKGCSIGGVVAFDTGPGNMVIDGLMQRFYGRQIDTGGTVACKGRLLPNLLHWMMRHAYLAIKPPKSTGRELFGEAFIGKILERSKGEKQQDIITTVTEYTALTIFWHYVTYIRKRTRIDELFVSGGGVHNRYLMEALERYFSGVNILLTESSNIPSDAKEAICFAVLANETIAGHPANVPGATGAQRPTVLGTICLP